MPHPCVLRELLLRTLIVLIFRSKLAALSGLRAAMALALLITPLNAKTAQLSLQRPSVYIKKFGNHGDVLVLS
jgi:hypothetical protein